MITTVEMLVEAFRDAGTPFIVGHPGGESTEMIESARQRDVRFILMKQESAGAMLAASWGELTGAPGVCLSTRGPGAANMVNGVSHAWLDRCPLLVITDQYPAHTYATGLRQRLDQGRLYAPVTKWSTRIGARTARQQIRRALRVATAFPPGPVHLDLPADETTREAEVPMAEPPLRPRIIAPAPSPGGLDEAVEMLGRARRPILLVGLGVLWCGARGEVIALAERLGAPVLTTAKCKGTIPEDHPLSAGCIIGGLIERELVDEADLIVTLGLDAVELQPKPWPYRRPVLSIACTPTLDALVPATLEVVGDLAPVIGALAQAAPGGHDWGETAAHAFRGRVAAALDTVSAGLSPHAAVETARAVLPRGTVVTCDTGASRLLVVQKWRAYAPREFLTSNGLGTMGFAIPGALAARLASPQRPVVAFTGDGGLLMAVAELHTAVNESLPIIVVVFDDAEIGLIRVKQSIKGLPTHGVALGGVDWERLAQGFGAQGTVVDTANGLADALEAAMRSGQTTLIGARIDPSGYVDQFNALREL